MHMRKTQNSIVKTLIKKGRKVLMTLTAFPYPNTFFFDVFEQHTCKIRIFQ